MSWPGEPRTGATVPEELPGAGAEVGERVVGLTGAGGAQLPVLGVQLPGRGAQLPGRGAQTAWVGAAPAGLVGEFVSPEVAESRWVAWGQG